LDFNGLHGFISQKIEPFMRSEVLMVVRNEFRVYQKKVLRRLLRPQREKVTEE
jgi:hypothetical protein